jgi:hypothetical protein
VVEQKKLPKRHLARLHTILEAWDLAERRAQERFGDRVKGSVRSSRWRDAEALRAAIALLTAGVGGLEK